MCLVETWQEPNDYLHLNQALPEALFTPANPQVATLSLLLYESMGALLVFQPRFTEHPNIIGNF